jgi:ribosomal protein L35
LWKSIGVESAIGKKIKRAAAICHHIMARRAIAVKRDLSGDRIIYDIREVFSTLKNCERRIHLCEV